MLVWIPLCTGMLVSGVGSGTLLPMEAGVIMVLAVLAWTLFEYAFHRAAFHVDRWIPAAERLCFVMHGSHHADPGDAGRRATPLVVSLPIFSVVLGAAALGLGRDGGLVFAGAFGLAYLAYDVTHYGCHAWRLPGRIGTFLKRQHLAHHYVDDSGNFGVTSPLWDWVFGTLRAGARRG